MFPLSPAEDHARLPVAVLSGFLGSGKTTLLNRLLRDPRLANTAVAINEFGAVPLDQHLIEHGADKTVVMANGCLCCNLAGDMEDAVMRIFTRRRDGAVPHFDRLIVEPSGLADPVPIALAILRQLDEHEEARHGAEVADVRLVSKGDLADTGPVRARLLQLNAAAPVLDVRNGAADPAVLFSPAFLQPGSTASPIAHWLERHQPRPHHHGADVASVSLVADEPLDWPAFDRWLRRVRTEHAVDLLRVKGILHVLGRVRPVVIQGVQHVLHPPAELEGWPDADRRSRLVLILRGAGLAAAVEASWRDAMVQGVPA